MTFFERLMWIFTSPYKTLKSIEEKPYILQMLLAVLIIMPIITRLSLML